jgi:hypothetical protein
MVQHLSRFARIVVVPFVVILATWQVALTLNHARPSHFLGQHVGWSARFLNPIPDSGTIEPLGPIDPQFVDASASDAAAFSQAMDRFAQTESWRSGWNVGLGPSNTAGHVDQDSASSCPEARPLVVVTRAGDSGAAGDVAETYFTSSGWDGTR